ncbi:MAG: hypothetical protein JJU29_07885 [Verrucomicrobia bacterium]|nr:hypothetical protein [Verrucomicrobiota bacterium]MCH8511954.1 hypothetical protein [Kiritimatiellia bacterium]
MPAPTGVGFSNQKKIQYTIRGVSEQTDRLLREKAALYGGSLNETALKYLDEGVGLKEERVFHDLDVYAGTWVADPACDEVLENMRKAG